MDSLCQRVLRWKDGGEESVARAKREGKEEKESGRVAGAPRPAEILQNGASFRRTT